MAAVQRAGFHWQPAVRLGRTGRTKDHAVEGMPAGSKRMQARYGHTQQRQCKALADPHAQTGRGGREGGSRADNKQGTTQTSYQANTGCCIPVLITAEASKSKSPTALIWLKAGLDDAARFSAMPYTSNGTNHYASGPHLDKLDTSLSCCSGLSHNETDGLTQVLHQPISKDRLLTHAVVDTSFRDICSADVCDHARQLQCLGGVHPIDACQGVL